MNHLVLYAGRPCEAVGGVRSQRRGPSRAWGRGAFTLVEMLVVVGVICVLIAILLPALSRAVRQAEVMRQKADFQTIGAAIEAYRSDFGDYPRDTRAPYGYNLGDQSVLVKCLLGPGPTREPQSGIVFGEDGEPGFGFRTEAGGRVYQPYLPTDKFQVQTFFNFKNGAPYNVSFRILDRWGTAIVYYPPWNPQSQLLASCVRDSKWHTSDCNYTGNWATDDNRMRIMLGDDNLNNIIDGDERLRPNLPYLLGSAGPDKKYGPAKDPATNQYTPKTAAECDDIFNFDR